MLSMVLWSTESIVFFLVLLSKCLATGCYHLIEEIHFIMVTGYMSNSYNIGGRDVGVL